MKLRIKIKRMNILARATDKWLKKNKPNVESDVVVCTKALNGQLRRFRRKSKLNNDCT